MDDTEAKNNKRTENDPQPRKALLGRRVVRHFEIRTGVKTGLGTGDTADMTDSNGASGVLKTTRVCG